MDTSFKNIVMIALHFREWQQTLTRTWWQRIFSIHTTQGVADSLKACGNHYHISIRTPSPGVTHWPENSNQGHGISIRTPTQGVTRRWAWASWTHFNPHPHVGSDFSCLYYPFSSSSFNPHPPRREWQRSDVKALIEEIFQSTLPRREWLCPVAAPLLNR